MPDKVQSPCIDICQLDRKDDCLGCGRSLEEIGAWGAATEAEKLAILKAAAARLSLVG